MKFHPFKENENWLVSESNGDGYELESLALDENNSSRHPDHYIVCGVLPGQHQYRIYKIPKCPAIEVAREFEVGSQSGYEDEAFDEISKADNISRLIPYFADPAGFKARFEVKCTAEIADQLEQVLESVEPMMDEEDGEISQYLMEKNGIHLWWD